MSKFLGVPLIPGADDCLLVCLRSIIAYHGYSEPDQVLANGWYFGYKRTSDRLLGEVVATSGMENAGISRAGFKMISRIDEGLEGSWQSIRRFLDSDTPVIATVDEKLLPFWSTSESSQHTVVVYGYDSLKETVGLVDGWGSILFKGLISLSDFQTARASVMDWNPVFPQHSGNSLREEYSLLEQRSPPVSPQALTRDYIEYSLSAQSRLTNPEMDATESFVGADGISAFAEDLAEIDKCSEQDEYQRAMETAFQETIGILLERRAACSVFKELAGDTKTTASIHQLANDIAREWAVSQSLIFKATYKREERTIPNLIPRLDSLAHDEQKLLDMLAAIV